MICEARFCREKGKVCQACVQKSLYYNGAMLKRPHDAYDEAYSLYFYDDNMKRLMYDIKVRLNIEPLYELAGMMAKKLDGICADYVTYVPSAPLRRITKGYNPAFVLAKETGRLMGVECTGLLKRKQRMFSPEIKKLDAVKRYERICSEFYAVCGERIRGRKILLIDDILTTGATLNRCSNLLLENGASGVIVSVIASGRKY